MNARRLFASLHPEAAVPFPPGADAWGEARLSVGKWPLPAGLIADLELVEADHLKAPARFTGLSLL
jgi:hypothetical protein